GPRAPGGPALDRGGRRPAARRLSLILAVEHGGTRACSPSPPAPSRSRWTRPTPPRRRRPSHARDGGRAGATSVARPSGSPRLPAARRRRTAARRGRSRAPPAGVFPGAGTRAPVVPAGAECALYGVLDPDRRRYRLAAVLRHAAGRVRVPRARLGALDAARRRTVGAGRRRRAGGRAGAAAR